MSTTRETLVNVDYDFINKELQDQITSQDAKAALVAGNERFVNKNTAKRDYASQIGGTSTGQFPHSVVLSCIDSRVPTEIVFDQGVGDIFNARVAGNVVDVDVLGSIEYAVKYAGSKLVVVMGHTSCGAVGAAVAGVEDGNIPGLLSKITPAVEAVKSAGNVSEADMVNAVVDKNVSMTIEAMKAQSEIIKGMADAGDIEIVGATYDIKTGKVTFH